MTKQCKIKKWGLEDEVKSMLDEGKSNYAIAKHISEKYSDVPELAKVNKMTVGRYVNKLDENRLEGKLEKIKDPTQVVQQEFNQRMRQNILDAEAMNNLVMEYKNKINSDDLDTKDLSQMLKAWQTANDQMRKNLVSIREYTDHHIIKPTQNIIYKKEVNIRNTLLDYARQLCPDCRKKVFKMLEEESNEL